MLILPSRTFRACGRSSTRSHAYPHCTPALIASHSEDRAIAPAFRRHLGLDVLAFDVHDGGTGDPFAGTFTSLEATIELAAHRARQACVASGRRLGIGSNGCLGPRHSTKPLTADTEVIVLYDREFKTTITECVTSFRTNFAYLDIDSSRQIDAFLARIGLPTHAAVVGSAELWRAGRLIEGLTGPSAVRKALDELGAIYPGQQLRIAADMRAHVNPTRMAVIRAAASRLTRRIALHAFPTRDHRLQTGRLANLSP